MMAVLLDDLIEDLDSAIAHYDAAAAHDRAVAIELMSQRKAGKKGKQIEFEIDGKRYCNPHQAKSKVWFMIMRGAKLRGIEVE